MPSYSGRRGDGGAEQRSAGVERRLRRSAHLRRRHKQSAMRALGWLHASERLFQMEVQRRAGEGRLAEMLGGDLVRVDRFIRTLGFPRLARIEPRGAVAGRPRAAASLRRRRQCLARRAQRPAAAGVPARRRCAAAMAAGGFAGHRQAARPAAQPQLQDRDAARPGRRQARGREGRLGLSRSDAQLADHDGAGVASRSRRARPL